MGWIPGHIMRVPGRKSGKMQTIPLYVLRSQGRCWLVAGCAQSDWVKHVLAGGWCELFHDHVKERIKVIEEEELGPRAGVLQTFVNLTPGAKRAYPISPVAPLKDQVAMVAEHPVFCIIEQEQA
jgi:hypothetical protein